MPGEWSAWIECHGTLLALERRGEIASRPESAHAPGADFQSGKILEQAEPQALITGPKKLPAPGRRGSSSAQVPLTPIASNYGKRKKATYVYLTGTSDAATWGVELALGEGPGRIYIVEPTGPIMDDTESG